MNVIKISNEFADKLCHLNRAIVKYLNVKKAREYCSGGHLLLPNDVINTILDVLAEKTSQYEKQIIELATKLTDQPEEQPVKQKN